MKNITPMKAILIISIIMFIISLILKTFSLDGSEGMRGFLNLLTGWLGALYSQGGSKAWLANPLLIASWIVFFRHPKWALLLSALAFFFAFRFYFQETLIKNEAGMIGKITDYYAGYWLWVSSTVVMILGSLFALIKNA